TDVDRDGPPPGREWLYAAERIEEECVEDDRMLGGLIDPNENIERGLFGLGDVELPGALADETIASAVHQRRHEGALQLLARATSQVLGGLVGHLEFIDEEMDTEQVRARIRDGQRRRSHQTLRRTSYEKTQRQSCRRRAGDGSRLGAEHRRAAISSHLEEWL